MTTIPTGKMTASAKARYAISRSRAAFSRVKAAPLRAMLPNTCQQGKSAQKTGTANAHAHTRHGQKSAAYSGAHWTSSRP